MYVRITHILWMGFVSKFASGFRISSLRLFSGDISYPHQIYVDI